MPAAIGGPGTSYGNMVSSASNSYAGIAQAYDELWNSVAGGISNVGQAQSGAIADKYTAALGGANQSLVSRGLGNTTVQSSVTRGMTLDEAKAQNALQEELAQMRAGYQTNIGLSKLHGQQQYQMQQDELAARERAQQQQLSQQRDLQQLSYRNQLDLLGRQQMFNYQYRYQPMPGFANTGGIGASMGGGGGGHVSAPSANNQYLKKPAEDPFIDLNNMNQGSSSLFGGGGGGYSLGGGGGGGGGGYDENMQPGGVGTWGNDNYSEGGVGTWTTGYADFGAAPDFQGYAGFA